LAKFRSSRYRPVVIEHGGKKYVQGFTGEHNLSGRRDIVEPPRQAQANVENLKREIVAMIGEYRKIERPDKRVTGQTGQANGTDRVEGKQT
jgi:hypothetical protein